MNENLFLILERLLAKNKIKINNSELRLQLFGHPTYPSLNSLTGVLDHFNIPNLALEIPKSKENINFLPEYFIAHLNKKSGESFALICKHKNGLMLTENGKKNKSLTNDQFLQVWSGIILGVDIEEYKKSTKTYDFRQLFIKLSPLVIAVIFFILNQNLYESTHFFLSILGIYICGLIFQHELGESSSVLDKICSGESKKLSCTDVINSKGGKFLGVLKLSDLGMIYFLFASTLSFVIVFKEYDFSSLYQISILALPFTIYSILYQLLIVKKWCLLCLSTIGILILQASIAFFTFTFNKFLQFPIINIPLFLFSLFTMTSLWFYISEKLKENKKNLDLQIKHNKFKRNFEIFNTLYLKSRTVDTPIPAINEIIFGNSNADLEIVIITNPLCGFCKNAHNIIHQILNQTSNVKIIVRFNLSNKKENLDTQIALKLIEIYKNKGKNACMKAMNDAYNNLTPQQWIETYGKCNNTTIYNILEKEKEWCRHNQILFTPEVLISGRSYPKEYDFEDLQYFTELLLEEQISVQSEKVLN
jgi:uncharacterized membrane protein